MKLPELVLWKTEETFVWIDSPAVLAVNCWPWTAHFFLPFITFSEEYSAALFARSLLGVKQLLPWKQPSFLFSAIVDFRR